MKTPGCTCSKRFSYTEEHDSDCDLWYVDEFWAGFLAWSPDEECLIRTSNYPSDHDDPWSQAYADDADIDSRLEQYEWINDEVVGCGPRDDDDAKISQMFMDKVLGKQGYAAIPDGVDGTWVKGEDGMWRPLDDDAEYQSALAKMGGTGTATSAYGYGGSDWSDDWYWKNHHRHYETAVTFPNGVKVQASSLVQNHSQRDNGEPDFALYLDSGWRNEGAAIMLPWDDWGLPAVKYAVAAESIRTAYAWAEGNMLVEVGCIGAHGRTGTALACMAILAGVEPTKAVSWVRSNYCTDAVEGLSQEWFVKWFAAYIVNGELPAPLPKPKPSPKASVAHLPKAPTPPLSSTSELTGDPNKPGRKKKTRRGKRGGRRVQRSRSMAGVR